MEVNGSNPPNAGINNRSSDDSNVDDPKNGLANEHKVKDLEKKLKSLEPEEEEHNFGTTMIHSLIETIEFVLGTISNTASYLRLWALSLAHGQLSEVFFNLSFHQFTTVFNSDSMATTIIMAVLSYYFFWSATFGIILCMDSLECFLHCLRLHWVEYMNKFYKGDGYLFKPYSFKDILNGVIEGNEE